MTEEELEICRRAASRIGKRNPSFDDVISELTPNYHVAEIGADATEIARWHRLMHQSIKMVPEVRGRACPVCGAPTVTHGKKYCSSRCGKLGPGDHVTPELEARVVSEYEAGNSLRNVAVTLSLTMATVRKTLVSRGVKIRPAHPRMKRPKCSRDGCGKFAAPGNSKGRGRARWLKYCADHTRKTRHV